ncbi:MAG: hypothetical protein PT947_05565 [Suipraeoptans intestinalis]|nr:hypothetical protein [Suipraeoptans intestinalis]
MKQGQHPKHFLHKDGEKTLRELSLFEVGGTTLKHFKKRRRKTSVE